MRGFKLGVERLQNLLLHLRPLNLLLHGQNLSVHHFHDIEATATPEEVAKENPPDVAAPDLEYKAKVPKTKSHFPPERQQSYGLPR
ncbi:hypothetical protein CsSME_00016977 [Camellia sinensis var. sinensis]